METNEINYSQQPTPASNLVQETRPRYVFAARRHKPYIAAKKDSTIFVGLQDITREKSMHVLEIPK